jgi:hypothetical protein
VANVDGVDAEPAIAGKIDGANTLLGKLIAGLLIVIE